MKPKTTVWVLAFAGLAVGLAAPRQSFARTAPAFVKEIKAADAAWAKAANAKDFDALADLYGAGAMVMPPGHASVSGHANIAAFWKAALGPVSKVELQYLDTHGMGAYAFRTGTASMLDAKGAVLETVKFVEVWHREPGGWKLYRDIFNANPPPASTKK